MTRGLADGMRAASPSAVTALGHALTLGWLCGASWVFGLAGLILDAVDGALARRLRVESAFGALYDWTVDVTCAALILARLGATPALLALLPLQVVLHQRGAHVSGRAALVGVAITMEVMR